jgi:hypothetical protein
MTLATAVACPRGQTDCSLCTIAFQSAVRMTDTKGDVCFERSPWWLVEGCTYLGTPYVRHLHAYIGIFTTYVTMQLPRGTSGPPAALAHGYVLVRAIPHRHRAGLRACLPRCLQLTPPAPTCSLVGFHLQLHHQTAKATTAAPFHFPAIS